LTRYHDVDVCVVSTNFLLTTTIYNLATQKLVGDLDALNGKSGQAPEDQWRSRILLRSAEEADQDIWNQIQHYTKKQSDDPTVRASFGKIHRDFKRVHATFRKLLMNCKHRQGAELSLLSAQPMNSSIQERATEEDFFDRAMKEREQEVMKINSSMQQVSEIYKDLAQLVVNQQEKVDDEVEGNIQYSRAATQLGAEHVKNVSRRKFPCGAVDGDVMDDDSIIDQDARDTNSKRQRKSLLACGDLGDSTDSETEASTSCNGSVSTSPPQNANAEVFPWRRALESIQNEMVDFHKDILGCVMSEAAAMGAQDILTCGSSKDVDYE
jgi:hypothetical protein